MHLVELLPHSQNAVRRANINFGFFFCLFFGSISVSGQLPTYPYPSPNPIVGLGDGVGGAVA